MSPAAPSLADLEQRAREVARRVDATQSVVPAWDWRALLRRHAAVSPAMVLLSRAAEEMARLRRIESGELAAEDAWLRAHAAQLLDEALAALDALRAA